MKINVTIRPRLRKEPKVEISSETGKLFSVVDDQAVRGVNPPPDDKKFNVDFISDQIVTNTRLFKCAAMNFEKYPLYFDPGFLSALNDIAVKAGQQGIEFAPFKKMLRALYREAERIGLYLKHLDKETNIESLLRYRELFKIEEKQNSKILTSEMRVFSELLGVQDFYSQFNDVAAKYYGKEKHSVLRKHFEGYARGHGEPSNWVCAVALEVLGKSGVNIFDLGIDRETIISIWSKSNADRADKQSEVLGVNAKFFSPQNA